MYIFKKWERLYKKKGAALMVYYPYIIGKVLYLENKKRVAGTITCATPPPKTPMIFFFFNCMFYQLLRVQHSCSSTQSWGSVLPSIVET